MEALVVDASSLVDWLVDEGSHAPRLRELLGGAALAGPPHLPLECGQALKNLSVVRDRDKIDRAFNSLCQLNLVTPSFSDLAMTAWKYRHNLSFYDASYLATALITGYPLLTSDRRLAAVARQIVPVVTLEG